MKDRRKIFLLLLGLISLVLSSCSQPQECDVNFLKLDALLISIDNIPKPDSWSVYGPNNGVIDHERSTDLLGIAFFSDLFPTNLGSSETVYRYNTIEGAERDFSYASNYFGDGNFPNDWAFISEKADESYIACEDGVSVDFPKCYWIARYDCIVIEFRSWLIPDRMTLEDMESIVREIDQKAGELIPDNY